MLHALHSTAALNSTGEKDAAQKVIQRAKDDATALAGRVNDLQGKQTHLQTEQHSTQEQLHAALGEIKSLNGKLADLAHQDAACEASNRKLYQLNVDLLERYRKKGVFDALLQHEPMTGIKDVETQNIVQKYRDELAAQKIPDAGGKRE